MGRKITIRVSGRGSEMGAPTVEDFLAQVRDFFDVLAQVEATLAEDGESAIEWRITGASKSSPLTIEAEAFPRQFGVNVDRRSELVVENVAAGFLQLQQVAQRPTNFNDKALAASQRIFDRVTHGLDMSTFEHDGELTTVELTTSNARVSAGNVREVLAPKSKPYKELGSIEGHFRGVDRDRGRPVFWIRHRLTGDEVKCFVSGEAEREIGVREIGEVWKNRRLQVQGTIHFKAAGRVSHVDAFKVRFLRDRSELPDIDEVADADLTGGLRSEDYLARLRDGD